MTFANSEKDNNIADGVPSATGISQWPQSFSLQISNTILYVYSKSNSIVSHKVCVLEDSHVRRLRDYEVVFKSKIRVGYQKQLLVGDRDVAVHVSCSNDVEDREPEAIDRRCHGADQVAC